MRTKTGIVVSNKMNKTIVVSVTQYKTHPKYRKRYMISRKFYAHLEDASACQPGDTVVIGETLPLSKLKRWKFIRKEKV
ncbi:30S ribosomal protein S17 [Candidatus Peregrinibacteria bacterium]|nr:30S ribosomal protein S17 [Candidatus Peregrinibacteria bacterium]